MKIAQVSATFPPYMAGTGNVCYYYAIELAKLGHEVTVFTSRYPDEDYTYPDIITVKRFNPLFRIGNAPFIPQLLREINDFDIVHLHYPFFFGGEMIYLLKKLRNQKYVVTYHNDIIYSNIYGLQLYEFTIMRKILQNASKILIPSRSFIKNSRLLSRIDTLLLSEKITYLPHGIDTSIFNPTKYHNCTCIYIRKLLGLEDDREIILFVGALDLAHHYKGLEHVLLSLKKIIAKGYSPYLLVIGDGNMRKYYMELAKKLDIANLVVFLGKIAHHKLPIYYKISDIVVYPSTAVESFGLVLIEAMAMEKPIIASNLPALNEIVKNEVEGYLIPPKDVQHLSSKIIYLLENPDVRKKFGKNGRKKVERKYTWEKIILNLEKIYRGVL